MTPRQCNARDFTLGLHVHQMAGMNTTQMRQAYVCPMNSTP
jgi:hypothetical protein